jgi:hypothetical protein
MIKANAVKSFHANGKIKCSCVLNESGLPIAKFVEYDESGKLLNEIEPEKCVVVFVGRKKAMDENLTKIESLEKRIQELEARMGIMNIEPEKIRSKFIEIMTLVDSRSLMTIFSMFRDETIAAAISNLTPELKQRILSCVSSTRRNEILEVMGIQKDDTFKIYVEVTPTADGKTLHSEVGTIDYSIEHQNRMLLEIQRLERRGEIVLATVGREYEIFV